MVVDNLKNDNERTTTEETAQSILRDLNTFSDDIEKNETLDLSWKLTQEFAQGLENNEELLNQLNETITQIKSKIHQEHSNQDINEAQWFQDKFWQEPTTSFWDLCTFLTNILEIKQAKDKKEDLIRAQDNPQDIKVDFSDLQQEFSPNWNNGEWVLDSSQNQFLSEIQTEIGTLLQDTDIQNNATIKNNLNNIQDILKNKTGDIKGLQDFLRSSISTDLEDYRHDINRNTQLWDSKLWYYTITAINRYCTILTSMIDNKTKEIANQKEINTDIQDNTQYITAATKEIQEITNKYKLPTPELSKQETSFLETIDSSFFENLWCKNEITKISSIMDNSKLWWNSEFQGFQTTHAESIQKMEEQIQNDINNTTLSTKKEQLTKKKENVAKILYIATQIKDMVKNFSNKIQTNQLTETQKNTLTSMGFNIKDRKIIKFDEDGTFFQELKNLNLFDKDTFKASFEKGKQKEWREVILDQLTQKLTTLNNTNYNNWKYYKNAPTENTPDNAAEKRHKEMKKAWVNFNNQGYIKSLDNDADLDQIQNLCNITITIDPKNKAVTITQKTSS